MVRTHIGFAALTAAGLSLLLVSPAAADGPSLPTLPPTSAAAPPAKPPPTPPTPVIRLADAIPPTAAPASPIVPVLPEAHKLSSPLPAPGLPLGTGPALPAVAKPAVVPTDGLAYAVPVQPPALVPLPVTEAPVTEAIVVDPSVQ